MIAYNMLEFEYFKYCVSCRLLLTEQQASTAPVVWPEYSKTNYFYYKTRNYIKNNACTAGYYWPIGMASQYPCPAGTYTDSTSLTKSSVYFKYYILLKIPGKKIATAGTVTWRLHENRKVLLSWN